MVAVVFDGDLEAVPAHVEEIGPPPGLHRNLRARLRKAGIEDEQPQPGLLRKLRAGVVQVQDLLNLPNSANAPMTRSQVHQVHPVEDRRGTEGVQSGHSGAQRRVTGEVEGGAHQRRHREAAQHDGLPCGKTLADVTMLRALWSSQHTRIIGARARIESAPRSGSEEKSRSVRRVGGLTAGSMGPQRKSPAEAGLSRGATWRGAVIRSGSRRAAAGSRCRATPGSRSGRGRRPRRPSPERRHGSSDRPSRSPPGN